jgi:hypothetical protein
MKRILVLVAFMIMMSVRSSYAQETQFTAVPNYATTICTPSQGAVVVNLACTNLETSGGVVGTLNFKATVQSGVIQAGGSLSLSGVSGTFVITGGTVSSVYHPSVRQSDGSYSAPRYERTAIIEFRGATFTGTLTVLFNDHYTNRWYRTYETFTGEVTEQ